MLDKNKVLDDKTLHEIKSNGLRSKYRNSLATALKSRFGSVLRSQSLLAKMLEDAGLFLISDMNNIRYKFTVPRLQPIIEQKT